MFRLIVCVACFVFAQAALFPAGIPTCHLDGKQYHAGATINVQCPATIDCMSDGQWRNLRQNIGGKREIDGQNGCLFDGRVYGPGETITIQPCLAQMTCEGHNVYSNPISLGGVCPSEKREVDGQTGCLFDGRVYAAGDTIYVGHCLAKFNCLGYNRYSEPVSLGGEC